jgi:hypothetical protein
MRSCASFPLSSGSTDKSMFFDARLRSARGLIGWLCTQERYNPEVAIIFGTAARYRRATVGSNPEIAPHGVTYGPSFASVQNATSFFVHFLGMRFRAGDGAFIFSMSPLQDSRRRVTCLD